MGKIINALSSNGFPTVFLGAGAFSIFLEVEQCKVPAEIREEFDTPVLCFTSEVEKIDFLAAINVKTIEVLPDSTFGELVETELLSKFDDCELAERSVFWSEKLYPTDISDNMDSLISTLNWDRILTQDEVNVSDIKKVHTLLDGCCDLPGLNDSLLMSNKIHSILKNHLASLEKAEENWEGCGFNFDVSRDQVMETLSGELRIQDFLIF